MDFKFKVVKCRQSGGCYCCEHTLEYDEDKGIFVDKEESVNSFSIDNQVIRLCDKHLKELISEGSEFLNKK